MGTLALVGYLLPVINRIISTLQQRTYMDTTFLIIVAMAIVAIIYTCIIEPLIIKAWNKYVNYKNSQIYKKW